MYHIAHIHVKKKLGVGKIKFKMIKFDDPVKSQDAKIGAKGLEWSIGGISP
jgi:hypothetical protein